MSRTRDIAAAGLLAAGVFSASFAAARPSPREALDGALRRVAADTARTVCLGGGECLRAGAAHTLFVFFSAGDCAGALHDTAVLEALYREIPRERLNVVGVAYGMSAGEARAFAVASGITYPLHVDPAGVERYVGSPRAEPTNRPVKVLVTRGGTVLETWSSGTDLAALRADLRRVRARLAS